MMMMMNEVVCMGWMCVCEREKMKKNYMQATGLLPLSIFDSKSRCNSSPPHAPTPLKRRTSFFFSRNTRKRLRKKGRRI